MTDDGLDRTVVQAQLEQVLASAPFRQSERSATLLRYLVDRTLNGTGDRVKEITVGIEALGRGNAFDPRTDPIVRAEASRLRARLERYYASEGRNDPLVFDLPKGAYAVRVHPRRARDEAEPAAAPGVRQVWIGLAAIVLVTGAFLAGAWSARSPATITSDNLTLTVELQSDERIASDVGASIVIAPDGRRVVFVSVDSLGTTHLRLTHFDDRPPVDLPGTSGGRGPFWSPDGQWIGFWAAGQLRKVAADGGEPVVLCDAPDLLGATWGADGAIVAVIDASNRLMRVDATGRTPPRLLVARDGASPSGAWPDLLPDGTHVLYTTLGAAGVDRASIEVASLRDGTRKVVVQGGTFARYVAPGYLAYVNQGTLYAIAFDPVRLEATGPSVPIVEDVAYSSTFGYAQVSFSATGTMLYRRTPTRGQAVARLHRSGKWEPLLDEPGRFAWPALSPDGRRLAVVTIDGGVSALRVFNLERPPRQAWSAPGFDAGVWTHDSQALLARRGTGGIAWLSASNGDARPFLDIPEIAVPWTLTRGDRALTFARMDTVTVFDLWMTMVDPVGDGLRATAPRALIRTRAFETYPAISPDGQWLAYTSNEAGYPELQVRSLADTSVRVTLARGARAPRWSPSGNELLYSSGDRLMAVSYVVENGKFVARAPHPWTPTRLSDTGVLPNFNLGLDGETVVALIPETPGAPNQVIFVQRMVDRLNRNRSR